MNGIFPTLARLWQRITLTEGEQSILLAFFGVAFFGAALALNVVTTLGGHAAMFRPFAAYDYWIVLSGALGGCAGLYMGRNWMGLPGLHGIASAIVGTVWISFLGGVVGGTLALPFYGTMFGPFTLFVSLFSAPLLAVFWACILMAAHFLLMVWRAERDTIFNAVLPEPSDTFLY
ncbi:MAG: hypothetical protein ACJAXK_002624 [Yoonia sp.]|jgi:hypothetical protein